MKGYQKHSEDTPKNARIKIEYSVKPTKVSFSYPDKKNQVTGSMLFEVALVWVSLSALIILLINSSNPGLLTSNSFSKFNNTIKINDTSYEILYSHNYTISAGMVYFKTEPISWFFIIRGVILMLLIFIPPFIIEKAFKKKLNSFYPRWQSFLSANSKHMIFTPKSNFKEGNYFEVPYFKNVSLTYKSSGEFSDLLDFIEIHEYPFVKYTKKKGKIKHIHNEFIWYSRFYYKRKPTTGKLEVEFQ